ncbi:hypothetical protein LTR17_024284 [Elasticomyces elasticus]|nr:hypothetical protein LTR17_024284 [Elasticomyces elasticus]
MHIVTLIAQVCLLVAWGRALPAAQSTNLEANEFAKRPYNSLQDHGLFLMPRHAVLEFHRVRDLLGFFLDDGANGLPDVSAIAQRKDGNLNPPCTAERGRLQVVDLNCKSISIRL